MNVRWYCMHCFWTGLHTFKRSFLAEMLPSTLVFPVFKQSLWLVDEENIHMDDFSSWLSFVPDKDLIIVGQQWKSIAEGGMSTICKGIVHILCCCRLWPSTACWCRQKINVCHDDNGTADNMEAAEEEAAEEEEEEEVMEEVIEVVELKAAVDWNIWMLGGTGFPSKRWYHK